MPQPTGLETKLEKLKDDLKKCEEQIAGLKKNKETFTADIAFLEKVDKEIDQVSTAYSKALDEINSYITNIDTYYSTKKTMIEEALKSKMNEINIEIKSIASKISVTRDDLKTLGSEFNDSKKQYETAIIKREERQSEYDGLKNFKTRVDDKLKKLKEYRKTMEEEDTALNTKNMYVYLKEIEEILTPLKSEIKNADDFKNALTAKWQAMDNAEVNLRKKEKAMNEKQTQLENKEKELEKLEEKRLEDIKEKIKDI
jgi:chromosome segregation ATPase